MHVLQVTPRYFPNIGGVEVVVQKVSETLVERGAQVTVYSVDLNHGLSKRQKVNGVIVKRFTPVFGDPLYMPEPTFLTSLRREKVDIVHVHNIHTLLPFLVALFEPKMSRLVVQSHYHRFGQSALRHSLLKRYRHLLTALVFSRADMVIVNSVYEKRILCEDFAGCKNMLLIPEGVDLDEIERVRHDPVKPKRILYIGALKDYKNVDKVLDGFAHLIRIDKTEYRLVIIGEGPKYHFLVNRAHELGIDSYVEWKSGLSRQQLLAEYAGASALVLLSPLESFSRVVYEALSIGVPVVVLEFGALSNLVEVGLAEGVKSFNTSEIADALLKATRKTHPKISDTINAFLDWQEYSKMIMGAYNKLLEYKML